MWEFEFSIIYCNVPNKAQTGIMGISGGEELLGERYHHEISLLQLYLSHVITPHCSLSGGNLTDTGAIALARALQDNKSLEELK